jgi:hypothetical protein
MADGSKHEEAVIHAFVRREKRDRFLGFLATAKNRRKFTTSLAHFRWFDPRFASPAQGIENVEGLLRSKGAGQTCWVISEDSTIDGKELELGAALEYVDGRQMGTILSCIPGRLAYFEGEDEALILAR